VTEADRGLVHRKLTLMARNLEDLGAIADLTLEEFTDDRFRQKGTERILQEVIEAAVDVNLHDAIILAAVTEAREFFSMYIRAVADFVETVT
jgi:uncharacterized protein YutE (UPF0331/DUF86 family)